MKPFKKIIFVIFGILSAALGLIGIVVPGLPTTPLLLLSLWLLSRSSKRIHDKLLEWKPVRYYVERYRKNSGMTAKDKVVALGLMWGMISLSVFLRWESKPTIALIIGLGLIGTGVMLFAVRRVKAKKIDKIK